MQTKKEIYEQHKIWVSKNRKKISMYSKLQNNKIKLLILQVYSKNKLECKYCGFDNIDALTIDHIHNNGAKHRKKLKITRCGIGFYCWLKKNNFPKGYQVLCANCQLIKEIDRRNN